MKHLWEYVDDDHLLVRNRESISLPNKDFGAEIIDKETVRFYNDGTYVVTKSDNKIMVSK